MSVVTSVFAFFAKALFGRRIAPKKRVRSPMYLRAVSVLASRKLFVMTWPRMPPSRSMSTAFAKKELCRLKPDRCLRPLRSTCESLANGGLPTAAS